MVLDNGYEIIILSVQLEELIGENNPTLPIEGYTVQIIIERLQINGDHIYLEFYLLI